MCITRNALVRSVLIGAAAASITVGSTQMFSPTANAHTIAQPAALVSTNLAPRSNDSAHTVAQMYRNQYANTKDQAFAWQGNAPTGCQPGAISNQTTSAYVNQINFFRQLTGLSPVTADAQLSNDLQATAMVLAKKGSLSHKIPADWPCMDQVGQAANRGAQTSNLALGTLSDTGIWMRDDGVDSLGHRRWMLLPDLGRVGVGAYPSTQTPNSNRGTMVLRVIHNQRAVSFTNPASVAWPTAGWFPADLTGDVWSWQPALGSNVNLSGAKVTVTDPNGKKLPTTTWVTPTGYGLNTLAWRPSGVIKPTAGVAKTYQVQISGLKVGATTTQVTYQVTLFNALQTVTGVEGEQPAVAKTQNEGKAETVNPTPTANTAKATNSGQPSPNSARKTTAKSSNSVQPTVAADKKYVQYKSRTVATSTLKQKAQPSTFAQSAKTRLAKVQSATVQLEKVQPAETKNLQTASQVDDFLVKAYRVSFQTWLHGGIWVINFEGDQMFLLADLVSGK